MQQCSLSSDLLIQLDYYLRIIFVNEPFLNLIGSDSKNLMGKNIEYTPIAPVFAETFTQFIEKIKEGVAGKEWSGTFELRTKGIILSCRIAPTVFEDGGKGASVILADITREKFNERALLESEATARVFIDTMADAALLVDPRGTILEINDTAALGLKKGKQDLMGKPVYKFLPEKLARSRRMLITRVLESKKMVRFDDERDGRWIDTIVYPVIVEDGVVRRIAIIARDITDQKVAEEALRDSEIRYRTLAESSQDLIFIIGSDDRMEYVNGSVADVIKKPVDQITGSPRASLSSPAVARDDKKILDRVFETGASIRNTGPLNIDGREHWFDHLLTPLKDPDGHVRSVLGISRDITGQRMAEEALNESLRSYQRILEQIFDAIVILKEHKIVFLNERAVKILGVLRPDELLGRPIADLMHPDSCRDLEDRLRTLNPASGLPVPVQRAKFFRMGGRPVPVEVMAIRFDDQGTPAVRIAFRKEVPIRDASGFLLHGCPDQPDHPRKWPGFSKPPESFTVNPETRQGVPWEESRHVLLPALPSGVSVARDDFRFPGNKKPELPSKNVRYNTCPG